MPAGIIPDEGLAIPLQYWLQASVSGAINWTMELFVNDLTPTHSTVFTDLTLATFGGYTQVTLNRSQWQDPVVSSGCATTKWGTSYYTWFVTGSPVQTVYGWAVVDYGVSKLRFIQRFDTPDINPVQIGGKFQLWPTITATSAPCASMMAVGLVGPQQSRRRKISG